MSSSVRTVLLALLAFFGTLMLHMGWIYLPRPVGVLFTVCGAACLLITLQWLRLLWREIKTPPSRTPFHNDLEE